MNVLILNPIAGRGAGQRLLPQIRGWLGDRGLDFQVSITDSPGHARFLAREAASQKSPMVVAVGGDGTSNEVLNGLMECGSDPGGTLLGIVPVGTGNDFAFGAGLPLDPRQACDVIASGHSRLVDVGWMAADNQEPLYFGNGVGMGFDAMANIESRKVKHLRGTPVYLVAVLRTLALYYHAPQTTVCIDERELVQPSLMVSVMNGNRMGGGFYMTPGSSMDDGLLDLCLAGKVSRAKMVSFVPRFMRGTHTTDPDITMGQGRRITVVSDTPWAAQVDGEIYGVGAKRYDICLHHRVLRMLCSSESARDAP